MQSTIILGFFRYIRFDANIWNVGKSSIDIIFQQKYKSQPLARK